ncbi:MAG: serine protein kinase PrkA [Polyangiaceae bacterium]|nr:serine protein kinase PrkA [Polyangiaceae bacterium]
MQSADVLNAIREATESVEKSFKDARRVLSFDDYLALFVTDPVRFGRDASRYVKDAFDHFGTEEVTRPWGTFTRYKLFDQPWQSDNPINPILVGQEEVQEEVYRALANFAREGKPTRLILLHGPNGSAKSTFVGCVLRALEHYSTTDDGPLYRFNWVFPTSKSTRTALGFGEKAVSNAPTYAYLSDEQIDAKLGVEVRDHPLFLFPVAERKALLKKLVPNASEALNQWLLHGRLSHKSQQIFEALLTNYKGSFAEVMKHVQVERYYISQRYRVGATTVGPQMSVDAAERQVTMDRSIGALPASLQAVTLFETVGELVDAAGGLLEFSDLLKRPLDAFKYLQLSIETCEVALGHQNVQLNCVMMGSANELHLDAFREHPEFPSFRGRFELVRTPYLRSWTEEKRIYDALVVPNLRKHVAPHATRLAAVFATLTRMKKPDADKYERGLSIIVSGLSAREKLELYTFGTVPERLEPEAKKVLRAGVGALYNETNSHPNFEGRVGVSPREIRTLLLDAAQSTDHTCLSPLAVLEELERLSSRKSEFEWLQQESKGGDYHDVHAFIRMLRNELIDLWEREFYSASGLVDENQYTEVFERYIQHVSVWVKKERVRNRATGEYEEPDEKLMREIEQRLEPRDPEETRREMISIVAAWAIDHPGDKVDLTLVFPNHVNKLRDSVYSEKKPAMAALVQEVRAAVREEPLSPVRKKAADAVLATLVRDFGYCSSCALDAANVLLASRFRPSP